MLIASTMLPGLPEWLTFVAILVLVIWGLGEFALQFRRCTQCREESWRWQWKSYRDGPECPVCGSTQKQDNDQQEIQ